MDHGDEIPIGQRIREIRRYRGLGLRAAAQLSGISYGHLGKIERGEKPVDSRRMLEDIARTLRIHPAELAGGPFIPVDASSNTAHASLEAIEVTLTEWLPGEVPDDRPARPWHVACSDFNRLVHELRPTSDYAEMGTLVPDLMHDFLIYSADPRRRAEALKALISTYQATGRVTSALGAAHLGYLAAERVMVAADLLEDPDWLGVAAWTRAQYISSLTRRRQYDLAVKAAELENARLESRGMAHLTAALAAAAQGDRERAETHLDEASDMADALDLANSDWGAGTMNFGRTNVGIWRVAIGVELGAGAGIAEVARGVEWQAIPISRQGAYWMELGRGLLQDKRTRVAGMQAILQAEELTPQQVRSNPFVRDAVSSMLTVARRDAGGLDLRGLAYRMGVAPIG
ncbi:helix-turn-helix domain-containing protein [Amycolatopsis lurida]|uniref:helix-turn-helix domain-containing protein n=1 Tax=Amycolatopsis lurida TaxID=31959 RepID=UPI00365B9DAE